MALRSAPFVRYSALLRGDKIKCTGAVDAFMRGIV
jgi:hypothetical protein